MEAVADDQRKGSHEEPQLELLLAAHDAEARSVLATLARRRIEALTVLEAADGFEAIEIGRERRPQIALLDVTMPRLGGIEAAMALRALQPQMRLALRSDDPPAHRTRAHEHRLLLFDSLHFDRAIGWLKSQAKKGAGSLSPRPTLGRKLSLECSSCGYGIARSAPPERCPMCQCEVTWIHTSWRLWSRQRDLSI